MTVQIKYCNETMEVDGDYGRGGSTRLPYGSTHVDRDDPAEFQIEEIRDGDGKVLPHESWPDDDLNVIENLCIEVIEEGRAQTEADHYLEDR
jgi:hypothetical protein